MQSKVPLGQSQTFYGNKLDRSFSIRITQKETLHENLLEYDF